MINKHFRETNVLETQNIYEEVQQRKVSAKDMRLRLSAHFVSSLTRDLHLRHDGV